MVRNSIIFSYSQYAISEYLDNGFGVWQLYTLGGKWIVWIELQLTSNQLIMSILTNNGHVMTSYHLLASEN